MVSVIVAAYNAGKYIRETIGSVVSRPHPDLELIVVNDGSSDHTRQVIEKLATTHPEIRLISIPHSGASAARNVAIDSARGEWILFLDADDLLSKDAIQRMHDIATSTNADIVCAPIRKFRNRKSIPDLTISRETGQIIISGREATKNILYQRGAIDNSMCGKLFRSSLFSKEKFRESTTYEDLDLFYRIFLTADRIAVINYPLYLYRQHPESFIHTFSRSRMDVLEVTSRLTDYMERRKDSSLIAAARSRQISANFNILLLLARNRRALPENEIQSIKKECLSTLSRLIPLCRHDRKMPLKNRIALHFMKLFAHL